VSGTIVIFSQSKKNILTLGFGLWALGFGLWALGFGLWALGFGLWALGFGENKKDFPFGKSFLFYCVCKETTSFCSWGSATKDRVNKSLYL
jgi:hypothetical protein